MMGDIDFWEMVFRAKGIGDFCSVKKVKPNLVKMKFSIK